MRCRDLKLIYKELNKKHSKAIHREKWLPNEIDRLQGLIEGEDKEKNYNQVIRLSEEIENNKNEIREIKNEIEKIENEFPFLKSK